VKGILIHVLGAVATFVAAVLFMLFLNGMLSSKPPFIAGHAPAGTQPDSTAAQIQPVTAPGEEHGSLLRPPPDSSPEGQQASTSWQPVAPIDTGLHDLPLGADEPATDPAVAASGEYPGAETPAEDTSPTPPADGPQLARMVRVYEKMRPKQVAQVFGSLPDDETVAMLAKMNERVAAKVIAAMEPSDAARLSQMLMR
jgi:hypothetical protein